MSISNLVTKTTNYLVPSAGQTNCVLVDQTFSANPFALDWRQYMLDNERFQPQGVYVDNTAGTGTLTITVNPLGFKVRVPAGSEGAYSFPAPNGMTMSVTGLGSAQLYFVDYPMLPSGQDVNVTNTPNVNILSQSIPLLVTPSALAQGSVPYVQNIEPLTMTWFHATITTATSGTVTPTPNTYLRKLVITASDNATLATAGVTQISVTLNGVSIYSEGIYLPTTTSGAIGKTDIARLDFDTLAPAVGASGTLVVSLSTALNGGQIDFNSYFAA